MTLQNKVLYPAVLVVIVFLRDAMVEVKVVPVEMMVELVIV